VAAILNLAKFLYWLRQTGKILLAMLRLGDDCQWDFKVHCSTLEAVAITG